MSGWLSGIGARSTSLQATSLNRLPGNGASWWLVLDQRRAPARCAAWLNEEGRQEFFTLFAGTELASLIPASPWLVEVAPGSPAAREAEAFCHQRLGWIATAGQDATLQSIAEHLQSLFVLPDPRNRPALITLQKPDTWTALLASADAVTWHLLGAPFSAIYTPTPQGGWRQWQATKTLPGDPPRLHLDLLMEQALKESSRAWWLSGATGTPMEALPQAWLDRLAALNRARITRASHLERLLPLIQREAALTEQEQAALAMNAPARKKTHALETLG